MVLHDVCYAKYKRIRVFRAISTTTIIMYSGKAVCDSGVQRETARGSLAAALVSQWFFPRNCLGSESAASDLFTRV